MTDRKAKLLAYKLEGTPAGIVQVKNLVDGKVYLERAMNAPGLVNRFRFTLKMGSFHVPALQADWNRLGEEAFEIAVVETLDRDALGAQDPLDALKALEARWLADREPYGERGYHRR